MPKLCYYIDMVKEQNKSIGEQIQELEAQVRKVQGVGDYWVDEVRRLEFQIAHLRRMEASK